jgi:hypothetical protein
MAYFSYKLEHDYGLAPNPFGGYCTLAVCKPTIRNNKKLQLKDWIFGTGSAKLKKLHYLIYAMQVDDIINFNQYWSDPKFQFKKPVLNGSLVQMYGDNFYHQDEQTKKWIQTDSAHSLSDGQPNKKHITIDTGGKKVLISQTFYYLGDQAMSIPKRFWPVCNEGRNMKSTGIPVDLADEFVKVIQSKYEIGIHGDPINWKEYF